MYKINALLYDNPLTKATGDYFAKVKPAGSISIESLAQLMVEEGSELKLETIVDILRRSDRLKIQLLANGYIVNTAFCSARLSISGKFESAIAKYDADIHKMTTSFVAGKALREALTQVDVQVLGKATVAPAIGEVQDALSGQINSTITANNAIQIRGHRIKIAGPDAANGIWFIASDSSTRTKCTQVIHNGSKSLIVMVPPLPPGQYQLEIVTQYVRGKKIVKVPRSVCFNPLLSID